MRFKTPRASPAAQNLRSTHNSLKGSRVFKNSCKYRTLRNVRVRTCASVIFTVHRFSHSHASSPDIKVKKIVNCTLVQALRLCTGRTAHWGIRGIALLYLDHDTRRGEGLASHSGRSLPRDRPSTHCTGEWVGPRAGLDRCGKSRPHRDSIPGPSSPSHSLYRLSYRAHNYDYTELNIVIVCE